VKGQIVKKKRAIVINHMAKKKNKPFFKNGKHLAAAKEKVKVRAVGGKHKGKLGTIVKGELPGEKAVEKAGKKIKKVRVKFPKYPEIVAYSAAKKSLWKLRLEKFFKKAVKKVDLKKSMKKPMKKPMKKLMKKPMKRAVEGLATNRTSVFLSSTDNCDEDSLTAMIKDYWRTERPPNNKKIHLVGLFDAQQGPRGELKAKMDSSLYRVVKDVVDRVKAEFGIEVLCSGYRFGEELVEREVDKCIRKAKRPGSIFVAYGGNTHELTHAMKKAYRLRDELRKRIMGGKVLYVSYSAGTCYSGVTPQIALDTVKPGPLIKNGFKICNLHFRPHCDPDEQEDDDPIPKGKKIEQMQRDRELTDDQGNLIDVPVVYMRDSPRDRYCVLFGRVHRTCSIMEPNPPPAPWR